MQRREPDDHLSGMCVQGKHGRCTGWMVVPNFRKDAQYPDISVRCRCPDCDHPDVDPLRHLNTKKGEPPHGVH